MYALVLPIVYFPCTLHVYMHSKHVLSNVALTIALPIYIYKNAISAFLLLWKILEELADDQYSSITKSSIYRIKQVHTTFYDSSGLTRNWMCNGSIYNVLYRQILCVHLARQSWWQSSQSRGTVCDHDWWVNKIISAH